MSVPDQQVGVVWPAGRSDGLIISCSLSGDLNYFQEGKDEPTRIVKGHQKSVNCVNAFEQEDGKTTLWTGSYEGRVNSWDIEAGIADEIHGKGHSTLITGLTHTSEGAGRIYSVGWDDTLRAADVASNTYTGSEAPLASQPKGITSSNNTVFVANADSVEIFKDGTKTGSFPSKSPLTAITATNDQVAIATEDLKIRICTATPDTLTPKTEIETRRNPLSQLAFTPDGALLAAGDTGGRITLYNAHDGSLVHSRWTAHTARITSLA
ncbi:WD40 repeat-like protein, partial [Ascosphaera atra]